MDCLAEVAEVLNGFARCDAELVSPEKSRFYKFVNEAVNCSRQLVKLKPIEQLILTARKPESRFIGGLACINGGRGQDGLSVEERS